jgi:glycosyltransferase involved in cell wall biosynthesis
MNSLQNSKITVAMITMNEEKAIAKVISDIQEAVPGSEILVIDSSKDQTPIIAEKNGSSSPQTVSSQRVWTRNGLGLTIRQRRGCGHTRL